jgi:hypothetical protein
MQAAYPPPRESCVRGADRAAVDKRWESAPGSAREVPDPAPPKPRQLRGGHLPDCHASFCRAAGNGSYPPGEDALMRA